MLNQTVSYRKEGALKGIVFHGYKKHTLYKIAVYALGPEHIKNVCQAYFSEAFFFC